MQLITINKQKVSKPVSDPNSILVHSMFDTIQGEGPFAGTPALFIRLAGCNLRCPACDTEYTEGVERMHPNDIVIKGSTMTNAQLVVITGGEPFRQDISDLCVYLVRAGFKVQIETNGTLPIPPYFLTYLINATIFIVCSPKTEFVHPDLLPHIVAFKYVLDCNDVSDDGLPIKALGHKVKGRVFRKPEDHPAEVFLQPVDVQNDYENQMHEKAVVKSCMVYGYRLCLQMHKIIGVE